jgi:Taurine catabolism dioxygenase TauD, TfdA family
MLTTVLPRPAAWRASTIDDSSTWHHALSDRALTALEPLVRSRPGDQPITATQANPDLVSVCAADIDIIRSILESGRGFVIITAGPADRFSPAEWQTAYWLLGQLLGRPMEQNVQGTLLYDVRDTGQDVRYGARFSVTNAASSFHTDNSFGEEILDYVGLLCLHGAKSGGQSELVSGHAVQEELESRHPGALEILRQAFHVDRRGGVLPGQEPTARVPIFRGDGEDLVIRYLRYWIEVGQEKAGLPLTGDQVNALDLLDRVASERDLRVEFNLRSGEMLFINNRWILHNRTAFEDFPEPERRRHYIRLWVRRPSPVAARL